MNKNKIGGSPLVGLAVLVRHLVDGKGHKRHALVLAKDREVAWSKACASALQHLTLPVACFGTMARPALADAAAGPPACLSCHLGHASSARAEALQASVLEWDVPDSRHRKDDIGLHASEHCFFQSVDAKTTTI